VQLAIAVDSGLEKKHTQSGSVKLASSISTFRILYVGNFLYLKGMHLGIAAYANFLDKFPNSQLTLVGEGLEEKKWKALANQLGINQTQISWQPWVPQKELGSLYQSHDLFLFPSLRDSGGMVVLEAMSFGLPVVCLNLGGPSVLVDETCGRAVEAKVVSQEALISRLTDTLYELASSPELMKKLRKGAREKAIASSWDVSIEKVYASLELSNLT
jgi:glycosyltransferase involved in cell wall biosynthesis